MGRVLAIFWVVATIVVNVTALAALLNGFGFAPAAWNPPFDAVGGFYARAVEFSFSAIAGPVESRLDWRFPWWSGHAAAIYLATASAIAALGNGLAKRESLLEAAASGGLSFAWPVAVAAFLWKAIRLRIVSRFAREHALALIVYFALVAGAYAGARYLNANLTEPAESKGIAVAHVKAGSIDWLTTALANIDSAGFDGATEAVWRRYAVEFSHEKITSIGQEIPYVLAVSDPRRTVLSDNIPRETSSATAPFVEVGTSGGDPRAAEWGNLMQEAARLHSIGDFAAATTKLEQALRLAEQAFGEEHPFTLTSLGALATVYYDQGRYEEAEPLYERALEKRERVLGKDHPDTLASVNNLAVLYQAQGRYAEAEPLYRRALEASERMLGSEHPSTLTAINNLAGLYRAQGRYPAAVALYERSLEAGERALGKEHASTLDAAVGLAGIYLAQGRYKDAELLFLRVVDARERKLGKDHPDTLISVVSLATLYFGQGRYDEAEPFFLRALAGFRRAFGEDHPLTLGSYLTLATLYQSQGRYGEAEPLFLHALAGFERVFGKDHPSTLTSVVNFAALYEAQGRYGDADALYVRALEGRERVLGKDHPDTLDAVSYLAGLYVIQGRVATAEALAVRVLVARERVLGKEHPDTLASVNNLAVLYQEQGRYAEAEPLYVRALAGFERVLGKDYPGTIQSVSNLAGLYQVQGRYGEAEPLFLRALEASERVLGREHPTTLTTANNLGGLYKSQGRYEEAESMYQRALAANERALGSAHPSTLSSVFNLAALYRMQGRYAEAEPLYIRALAGLERALGLEHPDTLMSLENYFVWRVAAGAAGHKSKWVGDGDAVRLLRESVVAFDRHLSGGVKAERLSDPTSLERRATRILGAFNYAILAGVKNPDGGNLTAATSALSQRFNLSSVAATLSASSLRLADPKRRALLDERTRLGGEIDDRFKALSILLSAPTRNPTAEASIKADIDGLQMQAAAITAQLRAGDQGQAEIDGVIVEADLAKVGAALGRDEALVAYSSVGGRYLAFVTTRNGSTAVALDVEREAIASEVTELRKGLRLPITVRNGKEFASGDPNDLPVFDLALANKLYGHLIAPLAPHLAGVKRLVIVPDGPLQSLPFGLLVADTGAAAASKDFERYKTARFLIDRYAVSMQPSVSAIRALRATTPRANGDLAMLGFADPSLSGKAATAQVIPLSGIGDAKRLEDLPELPQMRSLLNVVGAALGARPEDLRFREKAQEADFRSFDATLRRYRMLTFATHGLVSNEIKSLSLEEPALVMSLPPSKAGQKRPQENDGLLKASDIIGFDMDADLVILAACNTAAADGAPGAEPLSGLAKSFFYAGARSLLVSHWQADASSSAVLIPAMARYAEQDGFSEGLAKAQREMRRNAAFDPDPINNTLHYAHPAIWGAFTLIGDPGR